MNLHPEDQAFPTPNPNYDGNWNKQQHLLGLTKREWFAGQVMQGFSASDGNLLWSADAIAKYAVEQADALLIEFDKSGDRISVETKDLEGLVLALQEANQRVFELSTNPDAPDRNLRKREATVDVWKQKLGMPR